MVFFKYVEQVRLVADRQLKFIQFYCRIGRNQESKEHKGARGSIISCDLDNIVVASGVPYWHRRCIQHEQ
jgi:hypothetical protein